MTVRSGRRPAAGERCRDQRQGEARAARLAAAHDGADVRERLVEAAAEITNQERGLERREVADPRIMRPREAPAPEIDRDRDPESRRPVPAPLEREGSVRGCEEEVVHRGAPRLAVLREDGETRRRELTGRPGPRVPSDSCGIAGACVRLGKTRGARNRANSQIVRHLARLDTWARTMSARSRSGTRPPSGRKPESSSSAE